MNAATIILIIILTVCVMSAIRDQHRNYRRKQRSRRELDRRIDLEVDHKTVRHVEVYYGNARELEQIYSMIMSRNDRSAGTDINPQYIEIEFALDPSADRDSRAPMMVMIVRVSMEVPMVDLSKDNGD